MLARLEEHFKDGYVLNAGTVEDIASFAADLSLEITAEECQQVLDHIAQKALVGVTLDQVRSLSSSCSGTDSSSLGSEQLGRTDHGDDDWFPERSPRPQSGLLFSFDLMMKTFRFIFGFSTGSSSTRL